MLVLYMTMIDEENDKSRFELLYHTYRKQMAFVAMAVVHNEVEAEDIVHEVFLNIATRHMNIVNQIADETDLRNYMLKATKNTALNWKKKQKRLMFLAQEEDMEFFVSDISDEGFINYLCEKIEYEHVLDALKRLEPKYREVLYYHFVLEIPVPQTAKTLNQSLSATKKQLVRGKKKLLELLEGGKKNVND